MRTTTIYNQNTAGDTFNNSGNVNQLAKVIPFNPLMKTFTHDATGVLMIDQLVFTFDTLIGTANLVFGYIDDFDGQFAPDVGIDQIVLSDVNLSDYSNYFLTANNKYKFAIGGMQLTHKDKMAVAVVLLPASSMTNLNIGITNNAI